MRRLILLVGLFLFLSTSVSAGTDSETVDTSIGSSIEALQSAIQQLNRHNQQAEKLQKLQIAISYVDYRSRRIEDREKVMREKQTALDRLEDLLTTIEADPDAWENYYYAFKKDTKNKDLFSKTRPSEYRKKLLRDRIERYQSEILELEIEISYTKDDLSTANRIIEEGLDLINSDPYETESKND